MLPLRSVETPVRKRPREATAREPLRSTMLAMAPPWRISSLFWVIVRLSLGNAALSGQSALEGVLVGTDGILRLGAQYMLLIAMERTHRMVFLDR